ncbi:hypothetical protein [Paraflavitalea speifideaquila]|uniref:hypothetical protein n=1 Tax=Paraflavitalea speifideaquila TaxID=3076558 RepID=UPI0028E94A4B|nr:hypothetical protein [Paraflavitalea speifideiaquila]
MKSIPFYIGVLLIIPVVMQPDKHKKLLNGYGVGALLHSDQAILHEGIKDDIRQQAMLVWVDGQGKQRSNAPSPILESIMDQIRYVSIENTWFKIIKEVSKISLLQKSIAGTGAVVKYKGSSLVKDALRLGMHSDHDTAPVAGTDLPGFVISASGKVVVTVFAGSPGLLQEDKNSQSGQQEWALVIERYQSL